MLVWLLVDVLEKKRNISKKNVKKIEREISIRSVSINISRSVNKKTFSSRKF